MVAFKTVFAVLAAATSMVVAAPLQKRETGRATWYTQGGAAGACGEYNDDSAYIVAMNSAQYDSSKCGQMVHVTNTANGQSVSAKIADLCPGCGSGSLDLSTAAFQAIGDLDTGVLSINWDFE